MKINMSGNLKMRYIIFLCRFEEDNMVCLFQFALHLLIICFIDLFQLVSVEFSNRGHHLMQFPTYITNSSLSRSMLIFNKLPIFWTHKKLSQDEWGPRSPRITILYLYKLLFPGLSQMVLNKDNETIPQFQSLVYVLKIVFWALELHI